MSLGSYGVKLYRATTSGGTYTEVAALIDADVPGVEIGHFDDKTLGQANRWTPKVGTFIDGGQATFKVPYAGAVYSALLGYVGPDPTFWRITLPLESGQITAAKIEFAGLMKKVGIPVPEDGGRLAIDATIEVSGAVTFTVGS